MADTKIFHKSYANPHELIELLKSRGLEISDSVKAEHLLSTIGYYRLSAYMFPFLTIPKYNHIYKPFSTFEKVMMLYRFDKELRLFIFNEIEKFEVAVRCAIVNVCCEVTNDPFWMTNECYFTNRTRFAKTLGLIDSELKHSREDFINHFYKTYSDSYPPA